MATDSPSRVAITGSSVTSVRLTLSTRAPPMRADSCTCRRNLGAIVNAHRVYIRVAESPGVVEIVEIHVAIVCPYGGVQADPVLQIPARYGACHAVKCARLSAHQSAGRSDIESQQGRQAVSQTSRDACEYDL